MTKGRIGFIDIYRGVGILCMIIGHVMLKGINSPVFDKFIHAFHMPMFFFLSGYFIDLEKKPIEFVKKRINTLLIPYFVFGVFNLLILSAIDGTFYKGALLYHLPYENTNGLRDVGAIWFLTATFFSSIIYYAVAKYVKNRYISHLLVICISLSGCVMSLFLPFRMPWALDAAFVGVGFYHGGHLLCKFQHNHYIHKVFSLNIFFTVVLGVIVFYLIRYNGYINMRTGSYSNIFLFYINAFMSIVVIWNLSNFFSKLDRFVLLSRILNLIKYIGKNSITFLVVNQIIIYILEQFIRIEQIPIIFQDCIIIVLTIAIICCVDFCLSKTKLRVILGKAGHPQSA